MKNYNLNSFKEKANAVLLKDAMLKISGGMDSEFCHPPDDGKLQYSPDQINMFFSDPNRTDRFNSMYERGNEDLAKQRLMFFESVVGGPQG